MNLNTQETDSKGPSYENADQRDYNYLTLTHLNLRFKQIQTPSYNATTLSKTYADLNTLIEQIKQLAYHLLLSDSSLNYHYKLQNSDSIFLTNKSYKYKLELKQADLIN